jgi:hypothetical protein
LRSSCGIDASLLTKVRRVWREGGMLALLRRTVAYGWRRSGRRLMRAHRSVHWSGVCVHEDRTLDRWMLPGLPLDRLFDIPDYEEALVDALRRLVRTGDRVVVIGGGFGVTTVVAAQAAGTAGRVRSYDSSAARLSWLIETRALNRKRGPMAPIDVIHAHVALALPTTADVAGAELVQPEALPQCDVLEMDCEGGELDILRHMVIRPRVLIVETHGVFGASTQDVRQVMEALGYTILSVRLAEERMRTRHEEQDVRVITSVRE